MNNHIFTTPIIFGCKTICMLLLCITTADANDSAGYIATGGVEYIKNNNISMHSEDLYISKDKIRVHYQFKNLSNKDITETILFPLSAAPSQIDSDFADIYGLVDTFKVWSNNQQVTPQVHVRTFMYPLVKKNNWQNRDNRPKVDTTAIFKACAISDKEMMTPWVKREQAYDVNQKLKNCHDTRLDKFISDDDDYHDIYWESQIIYSWQQTFKANSMTQITHTYQPLVGGGVYLDESQYPEFCVDNALQRSIKKNGWRSYSALSYILTTGANWAKPITNFKLTVERDPDELVSFCWKGKGDVKKVSPTTFEIKETNFVPTHDFDVAFISR